MKSVRLASVWIVVAGLLLGGCGNAKAQGITAQQAEEMLKELRAIRQALDYPSTGRAIALSLLAGSTVSVTAQEEATTPIEPVAFTAEMASAER